MDKGIRAYARTYFAEQNALRVKGEVFTGPKANTAFRKAVMSKLMEEFGVTLASAATHYNEALIATRKTTPDAVLGLGRPDDKKGGRKKKEAAPAAQAPAGNEQQQEAGAPGAEVLESNVLPQLGNTSTEAPAGEAQTA